MDSRGVGVLNGSMGKIKLYYYDNVKSSYKLYSDIVELFCSRFVATLGSESGDAT